MENRHAGETFMLAPTFSLALQWTPSFFILESTLLQLPEAFLIS